MRRIIFSLLLVCSLNLAIASDLPTDPADKEEKISSCVDEYVKKQSKSYARIVKNNLYDLMNNFDRITSRIYGKKESADEVPYEDKIEALARVQCEAYYTMGVLK